MAAPTTRSEFKEYCLRRLGKPLLEINVDPDQVDDRVDDALRFYWDYHFDGTEKMFLKHQITANNIVNEYVEIPENIIGVVNIFDLGGGYNANDLFNLSYQFALNEIFDLSSINVNYYYSAKSHLNLIQEVLVGRQPIRYNRHRNRLHVDMDWNKVTEGQYLIIEAYEIVDPTTYQDVWKDFWLAEYATALIRIQWGDNLSKFEGMQLPGGITFNGERILQRGIDDKTRLEEQMINRLSIPVSDMIG